MSNQLTRCNVAKLIYFSKSTDIFANLALEDWLYTNWTFTNQTMLMLWRNEPCVVIGRHQNPWLECNFAMLPHLGAKLARRNSGGGTVYHDMENLNLTFFTSRDTYSRRRNLELVSRALSKHFNIASHINKREDLCINDFKISGTASKLGRTNAYHHCTLLVNANTDHISLALKNVLGEHVKTNASVSVRSPIMNLSERKPSINVDQVMRAVIAEFSGKSESNLSDGTVDDYMDAHGVTVVESIEDAQFPGVMEIRKMFLSEEWRFQKTPKFTLYRNLFTDLNIRAFLVVDKGKVTNLGIESANVQFSIANGNLKELSDLFANFTAKPFSKQVLDEFDMIVSGLRRSDKCLTLLTNI